MFYSITTQPSESSANCADTDGIIAERKLALNVGRIGRVRRNGPQSGRYLLRRRVDESGRQRSLTTADERNNFGVSTLVAMGTVNPASEVGMSLHVKLRPRCIDNERS